MTRSERARATLAALCAALVLNACGGDGGSDSTKAPSPPVSSTHVLFISDFTHSAAAALPTLAPQSGTNLLDDIVATTPMGASLAYDSARDILYAGGGGAPSTEPVRIDVYEHASTLSAKAPPSRSIIAPNLMTGHSIFIDSVNDEIWFAGDVDHYSQAIEVFAHASTLSGPTTPGRTLTNVDVLQFTVDVRRSLLYVMGHSSQIAVYEHAATLDGNALVARSINALYVDAFAVDTTRDILYLANAFQGGIIRLDGASTLSMVGPPQVAPINIGAPTYQTLAIDPVHDRMYAAVRWDVFVVDNISTVQPGSSVTASDLVGLPGEVVWSITF